MNPLKTLQAKKTLAETIVKLNGLDDVVFRGAIDGAMGALDLRIDTDLFGPCANDMFYEKLNTMGISPEMVFSVVQEYTEPYCVITNARIAGKAMADELKAKQKYFYR